jgi:predicted alpha/beta superfamily hydrolase
VKRKIAGAGGIILVVALLAIFGWYIVYTQSTRSELSAAIAKYESHTPVNVTFVVTPPENTPKDQVLYLSGSVPALGNWDAAGLPLQRQTDGKYTATAPDLLNGMDYAFKITRGTWGTAESDADGKEATNHAFTASKDGKVEVTIPNWIDGGKAVPGRVTMTGDVRLHKKFHSSILNNDRTLIVYLPPDYEKNQQQRYPVLYLQDGQNLMDEATSYQGIEWGIDEAAQKLIGSGKINPVVIVGVYNTETRTAEFTPPLAGVAKKDAKGEQYAKMLVDEVKPFIDAHYRTNADRGHSTIAGGSMGGLIALYTAKTHADKFGGVVALSPWLRLGDKPIVNELVGDGAWLKQTFTFIDMGTDAGHNYPGGAANAIPDAQQLVAAMEKAGLENGKQFVYREIEGGKHNEASWAATIDQVLLALYGKPSDVAASPTTQPQ